MTTIELRALVGRDGKLLLLRAPDGEHWGLPGGSLEDDAEDIDAAMESLLRALGIVSEDVAQDFLKTTYLPADGGQVVLNLYAPMAWEGEPASPEGHALGWFSLEEMAPLAMPPGLHAAILNAFGMADDDDGEILAGLSVLTGESLPPRPLGDRHLAGLDILRTLSGGDPDAAARGLAARTPEIAGDVIDFALGEVWSHPALDRKTRSLEVVAMLAALGGKTGPLRSHINGALNHGASPEQVVQTLRMVAVYAGFPAALEAWPVMEEVFKARGIEREAKP